MRLNCEVKLNEAWEEHTSQLKKEQNLNLNGGIKYLNKSSKLIFIKTKSKIVLTGIEKN